MHVRSRTWRQFSKTYKCGSRSPTTSCWKPWELGGIQGNHVEEWQQAASKWEHSWHRKSMESTFSFWFSFHWGRGQLEDKEGYHQDSQRFCKHWGEEFFSVTEMEKAIPNIAGWSEYSPQCWQQQIREVNMRQLLQSVFSPQSVWITINKTWNAFKNSIAKSLVSSWSLFILIKRADLEEIAVSSENTL